MIAEDDAVHRAAQSAQLQSNGKHPAVVHEIDNSSPDSTTDDVSVDISEKSASVQKYEDEWSQLYRRDDPELGELRRRAVLGNLRASRFRSVCWRCLLNVFSPDNAMWLSQLRQSRQQYRQVLKDLLMEPWDPSHSRDHPLSDNSESIWNQYFCDQGLQAVIRQDVVRTFPGVEFFRKDSIQDTMVNVLFCYARQNPAMCYRQGMHEILAPLLFVLHCDHQALLHTKEQVEVNPVISEILNPDYLEEDGYTLFCKIMSGIESSYRINDLTPDATGYFPTTLRSPAESAGGHVENEVVAQLTWIKDNLLAPSDRQLHSHLQQLDIPLHLFGIRWLRLLFGREFPLQDLLVLWDAIFAEGLNFDLVNFVVVAMLIAIRQQLLNGDYTTCLTYLMRYPAGVDITYIIEHALYLKDPVNHCPPAMTSFSNLLVGGRSAARNKAAGAGDHADAKKYIEAQGGGTLHRLKKLSARPRWAGARTRQAAAPRQADRDAGIVDGYMLDDPLVIRAEIQHAHEVMALCRLKLVQYHKVLKRCVYPCDTADAQQALDGVIELCTLLESRYRCQPTAALEIEAAHEAGEIRQRSVPPPSRLLLRTEVAAATQQPPRSDVALKTFCRSEGLAGQRVAGAPLPDPVARHGDSDHEADSS